jgi:SAM-dependent methyltransferase
MPKPTLDLDQAVVDRSVDLVVTDPPFADSVMYSELSDYFYVLLRQALADSHPREFRSPLVDDSREAVHNPGRARDADFYTAVLGAVFCECQRVLKTGGRLAFTFHHAGEVACTEETLGVDRARQELDPFVLERLQVARPDSCLRRHLGELDPAANSRFAKAAPELEHDLATDSLPAGIARRDGDGSALGTAKSSFGRLIGA